MAGLRPALLLAVLLSAAGPAQAEEPQPPPASHEVRLIRALALYRSGRLDLAWQAWEQLAREGNKEAAYVLRVLAPLKPQKD